jgi:hypothetical protein
MIALHNRRMKMSTTRLFIAAAVLALAGAAANSAGKAEENEAKLAKMLEGRTAGEPLTCIPSVRGSRLQVIDGVAMVYDSGGILYVARPTQPDSLGRDDILVIDRFGGQICHTDIVRTVDRTGGYFTGVVFLSKFVPYKKTN